VRTDHICTKEDINKVNIGSGRCLQSEMENAKAQFLGTSVRRGSIQSTICSVLDRTVGKCLRKPFPDCFSNRERTFLRNTLSEQTQNLFKVIEDLLKSQLGQISFSACSVFSGSLMTNPLSSLAYVVFAISSVYIIK